MSGFSIYLPTGSEVRQRYFPFDGIYIPTRVSPRALYLPTAKLEDFELIFAASSLWCAEGQTTADIVMLTRVFDEDSTSGRSQDVGVDFVAELSRNRKKRGTHCDQGVKFGIGGSDVKVCGVKRKPTSQLRMRLTCDPASSLQGKVPPSFDLEIKNKAWIEVNFPGSWAITHGNITFINSYIRTKDNNSHKYSR